MLDVPAFRDSFPQFTEELFPNARVSFYISLARKRMSRSRWGDLMPEGMGFFVAHYLSLEKAASKVKDGTGGLDIAAGPLISETKTVGSISKSTGKAGAISTGHEGAGHWNDTIYGKQYYELMLLVGVGGVHL